MKPLTGAENLMQILKRLTPSALSALQSSQQRTEAFTRQQD